MKRTMDSDSERDFEWGVISFFHFWASFCFSGEGVLEEDDRRRSSGVWFWLLGFACLTDVARFVWWILLLDLFRLMRWRVLIGLLLFLSFSDLNESGPVDAISGSFQCHVFFFSCEPYNAC